MGGDVWSLVAVWWLCFGTHDFCCSRVVCVFQHRRRVKQVCIAMITPLSCLCLTAWPWASESLSSTLCSDFWLLCTCCALKIGRSTLSVGPPSPVLCLTVLALISISGPRAVFGEVAKCASIQRDAELPRCSQAPAVKGMLYLLGYLCLEAPAGGWCVCVGGLLPCCPGWIWGAFGWVMGLFLL